MLIAQMQRVNQDMFVSSTRPFLLFNFVVIFGFNREPQKRCLFTVTRPGLYAAKERPLCRAWPKERVKHFIMFQVLYTYYSIGFSPIWLCQHTWKIKVEYQLHCKIQISNSHVLLMLSRTNTTPAIFQPARTETEKTRLGLHNSDISKYKKSLVT